MTNVSPDQLGQILTLVYILVAAIVALGSVGMVGLVMVLKQNQSSLHLLYEAASPATQSLLRNIAVASSQLSDEAVQITAPDATTTTTTTTTTPAMPSVVSGADLAAKGDAAG